MTAYVGGGVSFWLTVFDDNDDNEFVAVYRARQLYTNISMLFLFPVKRDLLFTNI